MAVAPARRVPVRLVCVAHTLVAHSDAVLPLMRFVFPTTGLHGWSGAPIIRRDGRPVAIILQADGCVADALPACLLQSARRSPVTDALFARLPHVRLQPITHGAARHAFPRACHAIVAACAHAVHGLRAGDALVSADGLPVAPDGSVVWQGARAPWSAPLAVRPPGSAVRATVLRAGVLQTVSLALVGAGLSDGMHGRTAERCAAGGLVFANISLPFLKSFGDRWMADAPPPLVRALLGAQLDGVLLDADMVLGSVCVCDFCEDDGWHESNLAGILFQRVVRVNGLPITCVQDLLKPDAEHSPDMLLCLENGYVLRLPYAERLEDGFDEPV